MRFANLRSGLLISAISGALVAAEVAAVLSSLGQLTRPSQSPGTTPIWMYVLALAAMPSGTLPTLACLATACWALLRGPGRAPFLIAGLAILDCLSTAVSLCGRAASGLMTCGGYFGLGAAYFYAATAALALITSICLTVILIPCCAIRARRFFPAAAEGPGIAKQSQWPRRLLRSAAICFLFYVIVSALLSAYSNWAGRHAPTEFQTAQSCPSSAVTIGLTCGLLLIVEGIWPSPIVIAGSGARAGKWRLALIVCGGATFAAMGDSCYVSSGAMRNGYLKGWVWCEAGVIFAVAYLAAAIILAMKTRSIINHWRARPS